MKWFSVKMIYHLTVLQDLSMSTEDFIRSEEDWGFSPIKVSGITKELSTEE